MYHREVVSERPFFDVSWLAVPGAVTADLLDALELSTPREVSWQHGLSAVLGDYWDFEASVEASLSRVFAITLPGGRWSCLIGGWFGDVGKDTLVSDICVQASRARGQAHAFTTQGRMDWYAWTAAREGTIVRRVVWAGEPMLDEGAPAAEENWDDEDASLEDTVCRLASVYATGPDECGAQVSGLLTTTPWGRTHGVPRRAL